MRGFLGDSDALSREPFRRDVNVGGRLFAAGEASGRVKIAISEGNPGERSGRYFVRCNDGICFTGFKSGKKLLPGACLDIARGVEFKANSARQIDVESDEHALFVVEIEGRKIAVGQEAHDDAPRRGGFGHWLRFCSWKSLEFVALRLGDRCTAQRQEHKRHSTIK